MYKTTPQRENKMVIQTLGQLEGLASVRKAGVRAGSVMRAKTDYQRRPKHRARGWEE